jgi:urate oxidase
MQSKSKWSDEEIHVIASKYIGMRKKMQLNKLNEKAVLNKIPKEGKFILYIKDLESIKRLIFKSGMKILSEYPLINGIVIFGKKEKVFRLILNELVKEFDIVRKVKVVKD